jgi:hypothetical protein
MAKCIGKATNATVSAKHGEVKGNEKKIDTNLVEQEK